MVQTIRQYMASVRRCTDCPPDIKYQSNVWPYPQAEQSHLSICRGETPYSEAIRVYLDGGDIPGQLLTIRPGELHPAAVVKILNRRWPPVVDEDGPDQDEPKTCIAVLADGTEISVNAPHDDDAWNLLVECPVLPDDFEWGNKDAIEAFEQPFREWCAKRDALLRAERRAP